MKKKVLLIILDGWGIGKQYPGNAIYRAKTDFFDSCWRKYPHAVLKASGRAVGLPPGQMGTSEVNHLAIGAGRVVFQDLVRINQAIKDGSFFKNKVLKSAFTWVKKHNSTLHIKGLVSPGGVHSHQDHLYALLESAKRHGAAKVLVHVFTDGRDTLPKSGLQYVLKLEKFMQKLDLGEIASISGRYYAMDRDHNWQRTDKVFALLTKGRGQVYSSARQAIETSYRQGITDEFILPCLLKLSSGRPGLIRAEDGVIFVNFRNDRPRQLVERFLHQGPKNLKYVTFCQYNPDYQLEAAFPPVEVKKTLGEIISQAGLKQLRITETEKFAHLTFFMNAKREEPFEGEDRIMLNSYSDIATHDQRPAMRTPDIARKIIEDIRAEEHEVIFTNLCNGDMVGHTGNLQATIKGIETINQALAKVIPPAQAHNYAIIITADHGNAEEMLTTKGERVTAHSCNPVPFILISSVFKSLKTSRGSLIKVAPTILKILNLSQPKEMTGRSLI